jgi:hypothetical protein
MRRPAVAPETARLFGRAPHLGGFGFESERDHDAAGQAQGADRRAGTPAEVLTEVYGTEVEVALNDISGAINVLPLSCEYRRRLHGGDDPDRGRDQ